MLIFKLLLSFGFLTAVLAINPPDQWLCQKDSGEPGANENPYDCIAAAEQWVAKQTGCDGKSWIPNYVQATLQYGSCCVRAYREPGGTAYSADWLIETWANAITTCQGGGAYYMGSHDLQFVWGNACYTPKKEKRDESASSVIRGEIGPLLNRSSTLEAFTKRYLDDTSLDLLDRSGGVEANDELFDLSQLSERSSINLCQVSTANTIYNSAVCVVRKMATGAGGVTMSLSQDAIEDMTNALYSKAVDPNNGGTNVISAQTSGEFFEFSVSLLITEGLQLHDILSLLGGGEVYNAIKAGVIDAAYGQDTMVYSNLSPFVAAVNAGWFWLMTTNKNIRIP